MTILEQNPASLGLAATTAAAASTASKGIASTMFSTMELVVSEVIGGRLELFGGDGVDIAEKRRIDLFHPISRCCIFPIITDEHEHHLGFSF
jgi:hypothetical protein